MTSPVDDFKSSNPEMFAENSKYKPKMTFVERCEALAAYKGGVERPVIAACYGINVATLNHILWQHSKHYKNVRQEYADLGHQPFIDRYLKQSVLERLAKAAHDWKATIPAKDYDEVKKKFDEVGRVDPRAKKMEGRHTLFWLGAGTVYVAVTYVDAPIPPMPEINQNEAREPGWYVYVDKKSPGWQDWIGGEGPFGVNEDRRTSTTAFEGFARLIGHEFQES